MTTNTQVNQQVLSPEQQALAQAELAQMQKRMGFEDFMAEILLGGVPGVSGAGAPAIIPPTTPGAAPTTSALQQAVNNGGGSSIGTLLMPNGPRPQVGSFIDQYRGTV